MALLDQTETVDVTINSGASLSGAANLAGKKVVAVVTPAAWTAAAISFDVSADGGSYFPFYTQSGEVSIASAQISTTQARYFALDPSETVAASFVKVRSGLKGAEVNQGAQRTITLVLQPLV